MNTSEEEQLVQPTQQFWTNAYQTNIGKLVGICYRYTHNYQLSEDLAHDAFVKAIEKFKTLRSHENFDAWLRMIVVNHVLQHLRNLKQHPYSQQLPADDAGMMADQETTAEEQQITFTTAELLSTVARLPEHHRLVFNLYVFEQFTHAQIGEQLDISEGTSKSHLARARKKLQQLLAEKIETQRNYNKERAAILLLTLADDTKTDQLFFMQVNQLSIVPKKQLFPAAHQPATGHSFKTAQPKTPFQIVVILSSVVVVTLAIFILARRPGSRRENHENQITATAVPADAHAPAQQTNKQNIAAGTATISANNIYILRNKKLHLMKPLDSLALILALSTAPTRTVVARDSIKHQIEWQSLQAATAPPDSSHLSDPVKPPMMPSIDPAEQGSFRATGLFWRKDNLEVDFKGDVRVDFKDQHFQGKGTFNFLGKVHLLIVEGEQVIQGKMIKLSNRDYHLTLLNGTEAAAQYGDQGKNGAVVITRRE